MTIDDSAPGDRTAADRRAEARLIVSEEALRLATDAAEIGTWDFDLTTGTLAWSDRTKAMFGISADAPMTIADFYAGLHPDDHAATAAAFAAALDPTVRASYDVEFRAIGRDDGAVRRVAARGKGIFDSGVCIRGIGTAIDITERHAARERLRDSEDRLAASEAFATLLLESTSEAFYSVDITGVTTSCNRAFVRLLGFASADAAIGRRLHDVIHHSHSDGRHYPVADCPIYRAASRGVPAHVADEIFHHLDGTAIAVDYRAEPIIRAGVLAGAICTISNVTARRAAETALRELNETLEARVVERTRERDRTWRNSRDLLFIADWNGIIESVNPAWTTLLGWAESEMIGRPALDFVHPDDLPATTATLSLTRVDFRPVIENRCRHRDGSFRDIAWVSTPEGGMIYASGRNVTAEKAAAARLAAAEAALRQAHKMEAVGQLTGGIAHDFNNLLQIVVGNLDLLQRALPADSPRLRRVTGNAMAGAQRAATLTRRLLAFSRQQPLDPCAIDVEALITSMTELIGRSLGETISVDIRFDSALWLVEADPNQLENAILNLAVNARDAMPMGGPLTIAAVNRDVDAATATAAAIAPGRYVAISVTDAGVGMDTATTARVFEPFFTTKDVGKGTGLGLAMVYGFVRQSNGHVELASIPAEGTTVTLLLPAIAGTTPIMAADDGPSASPVAARAARTAMAVPATILVVEDDADVRAASVEMLGDLGYTVITADDGASALAILDSGAAIDLLFSDIVLPGGMTGVDIAARAKILCPEIRVLFTTGYARSAFAKLDARVEVLDKPFTAASLAARIEALLAVS